MSTPRSIIQLYKYDEARPAVSPRKVQKPKRPRKPAPGGLLKDLPAALLKDLPPMLRPGITIVFVGFNPGVESSRQQHHYAHHSNLFWKLFNALDVLAQVLRVQGIDTHHAQLADIYRDNVCVARAHHDQDLVQFGVGFTDLVLRCTRLAHELSRDEKLANMPRLFAEFALAAPPFVVLVGKGIWETVVRFLDASHRLRPDNFAWGLQPASLHLTRLFHARCKYRPRVYVVPNTSGLAGHMKYAEKLAFWRAIAQDIERSRE